MLAGRLLSAAVSEVSWRKESMSATLDTVNKSPLADTSRLRVSLACGRPGLFRLDLYLASESVPRCCFFYCLVHLDSISNTCLPPPNGLFHTHTDKHTHTPDHINAICSSSFCIPALDRGVGWGGSSLNCSFQVAASPVFYFGFTWQ